MISVAVLGATGSIGSSTLKVLRAHRDRFRVQSLAARSNWQALLPIVAEFQPDLCVLEDEASALLLREALSRHHAQVRVEGGAQAVSALAAASD